MTIEGKTNFKCVEELLEEFGSWKIKLNKKREKYENIIIFTHKKESLKNGRNSS